jgi:DNA-binding transcriptional MerR regulator/methylmalonyl-CoA mutase cobalamin-binding subunit
MYTIKQAALRSGVNVALLRAWERRYGIVEPMRTDSGYRLYDEVAIDRLRAMRSLVDAGWSARQAAERVTTASPDEIGAMTPSEPEEAEEVAPLASTIDGFVAGATRIDPVAIERALDDMFAAGSFERVVEDRLFPALRALGDAWGGGMVDVAGEHAASAAVARRLSMAFEAAGSRAGGPAPILVGLPPGARHELAALAFATAARRAGLPVVYLGPDVPVASWTAAVEQTAARAIAFGVVMGQDVAAADEVATAVRAVHPDLVIAVGGRESARVGNGAVLRLPDRLTDAVEVLRRALD